MRLWLLLVFAGLNCWPVAITAGMLSVSRMANPFGDFSLIGSGFAVTGLHSGWAWRTCNPCQIGEMATPSFLASGSSVVSGTAIIGDTVYPNVFWSDLNSAGPTFLAFTATTVQLTGAGTFYGTFQFAGALCGYQVAPAAMRPCDIVLNTLTGTGTYAIVVKELQDSTF